MTEVSIIVRCYNEEAHIGRLLSGIMKQSIENIEVIIVDSGSTDATISIASQFPVKVLSINKESFSFGGSLNIGCGASTGKYLVFASAHVYPLYDDWVAQLLQPFEDDQVACVYGKQRGNAITKFSEHQIFAQWFPEEADLNQSNPFCNNANAAVRRDVWKKFRYDETLTGLEDIAWAKQVISNGYRVSYQPSAEVIHVHDEAARQTLNRYRREAIAMKAIFPNETFSFFSFIRMWVTNTYNDSRLAIKQNTFRTNIISIVLFRLMQSWGTYRGYAQVGQVTDTLRKKFYYPNESQVETTAAFQTNSQREVIDYSKSGVTDVEENI